MKKVVVLIKNDFTRDLQITGFPRESLDCHGDWSDDQFWRDWSSQVVFGYYNFSESFTDEEIRKHIQGKLKENYFEEGMNEENIVIMEVREIKKER